MPTNTATDTVQGVGDYEAARTCDDAVREFVEAGEVQKSADETAPGNRAEAGDETERAEQGGRPSPGSSSSKDEGPVETSPTSIAQPPKGN